METHHEHRICAFEREARDLVRLTADATLNAQNWNTAWFVSERRVDALCGWMGRTSCGFFDGIRVIYRVGVLSEGVCEVCRIGPTEVLDYYVPYY